MYKTIKWTSAILVGLYASLCLSVFSLQKNLFILQPQLIQKIKELKKFITLLVNYWH